MKCAYQENEFPFISNRRIPELLQDSIASKKTQYQIKSTSVFCLSKRIQLKNSSIFKELLQETQKRHQSNLVYLWSHGPLVFNYCFSQTGGFWDFFNHREKMMPTQRLQRQKMPDQSSIHYRLATVSPKN